MPGARLVHVLGARAADMMRRSRTKRSEADFERIFGRSSLEDGWVRERSDV